MGQNSGLLSSLNDWNSTLAGYADSISSGVVMPIALTVLALFMVLELYNFTQTIAMNGGSTAFTIQQVALVMLKITLCRWAVLHSTEILNAMFEVAATVTNGIAGYVGSGQVNTEVDIENAISALPGGNSSWAFWERGSAYFWTSYTSDSGPASFTLGGTTMISQSYYESAGLSVRCIKKAEPEPEPEPAATVKDIDGNEYPVVEIGGLTWMAANLKTLHLNDGTEIPIGKGQEASWDTFTTPTACDFMDKTENRATYGLLYNFYTVDTGKICPEGWTVPDWDQMQSLLDAVPKAADLMAPDSRWNHYNPTNASGFGALPGGIQSYYYWLTSDAGIWTSYKGDDSPGYLYLSNMPYIAQSYLYSGMYVRCIKSTNTSDL